VLDLPRVLLPAAAAAVPDHLQLCWSSWTDVAAAAAAAAADTDLLSTLGESCSFLQLKDFMGLKSAGAATPAVPAHICMTADSWDAERVSFRSDKQSVLSEKLSMLPMVSERGAQCRMSLSTVYISDLLPVFNVFSAALSV
jgi:hypothetical protein